MGVRSPLVKSYAKDVAWSLLDASPDATLVVACCGEIVFANDRAGELFGFDLEDLLGRALGELLPEALRAVHGAHRTRFRAESTVGATGAGSEQWARRSDGSEFLVEISLSPLWWNVLKVVTEATDGLGIEPRLQFEPPIELMEVHIADHLTPVLREALSNSAHHAQAGLVRVAVSVTDDVSSRVSDDGGVPAEVLGGRGLTNMSERARKLGGDFTISPQPPGRSVLV